MAKSKTTGLCADSLQAGLKGADLSRLSQNKGPAAVVRTAFWIA